MTRGVAIMCCVVLSAWGCSEDFSPIVEGTRPYVVFGLLNAAVDTQYIRVHSSSSPTEPDPGNPPLSGASVTVSNSSGTVVFHDTLLVPNVQATDTSMIPAFVAYPFRPVRGATYSLLVQSPLGNSTGTVTVPENAVLVPKEIGPLQSPWVNDRSHFITCEVNLSSQSLGFAVLLLIEYEHLVSGQWIIERREVPVSYENEENPDPSQAVYPALVRRSTSDQQNPFALQESDAAMFINGSFRATLKIIYDMYGPTNVRMRRALFVLNQAERNFFTYYALANFFQDRFSIRADQPDFSSMSGSLGFFGAITADTVAVGLPTDLQPSAAQ